jgi:hypothetical protein
METRPDADGLRRLRVVLVVECPRLAHDRVSGDPHSDFCDATLSRDCSNTFKIFRSAKFADPVNRSPLSKSHSRRDRRDRVAASSRCRSVFNGCTHTISLVRREYLLRKVRREALTRLIQASAVPLRIVQPLEGSS